MNEKTKKKLWFSGLVLLPFLVVFLPYHLVQSYHAVHVTSSDYWEDLAFFFFGFYVFNILLAHIQLFLSLRILWFKKETCSEFSHQFHKLRFGVTLIFYSLCFFTNLFSWGFENESLLEITLILCVFYLCGCLLTNLINLGHWIYTKIPRKPKEETPKEETDEEAPAHKYKRELERSAIKKWIAIVLAACLLLCAGYLFGYDYNLPTVTATTLTQTQVESFLLGDFTYNRDMEATHVVNNDTFEGVIHYRTLVTDPANARVLLDTAKNDVIYRDLSTHYTFDSIDAEAVIPPCYYTPLVKKWGYGWFDQQGNLYADRFGKEKAENVPNYRRYFRIIVRKENAVFDYLIFTNQTNQFSVIHAVREICNTL